MEGFITDLRQKLSKDSVILTAIHPDFAAAYERWSDIDRKKPAGIIQPANEQDVAVLVSEYTHIRFQAVARQLLSCLLLCLLCRSVKLVLQELHLCPPQGAIANGQWLRMVW